MGEDVLQRLGHDIVALVQQDEGKLIEYGLLTPRSRSPYAEQTLPAKDRLTDLGIGFRHIDTYCTDLALVSDNS
jgi:hypothetical protein